MLWDTPTMHVQWINLTMHVQWTNPGICCMYKGPILWGHDACYKEPDACKEDQSYGTVHIATCIYVRTVSSEGPVIWELNMHKE